VAHRSLGRGAATLVVALSTLAPVTRAQSRTIYGTVRDTADRPVRLVTIVSATGNGAITDDSGRFHVEIPHRDRISFDVRRIGFMPSRLGLPAGGDTNVSVLLLPTIRELPAVEVTNSSTRVPSLAGFEQRMLDRKKGAGSGYFLTPKDFEPMNASRTTQIFEMVPGMTARRVSSDGQRWAIFGKTTGGAACPATVFLDGIRLGGNGNLTVDRRGRYTGTREVGVPIDEYIQPAEIAGIEIYPRGMLAPPQFQPPGNEAALHCAMALVWTKHGG
jgi:hypothetical protein